MTGGTQCPAPADQIVHDVPRLGSDPDIPLVFDIGDAAGLRRIVEAQATELVRLRRALAGARSVAARRLSLIRSGHADLGEDAAPEIEDREELLATIRRVEEDIRSIVEGSRWRRLGQRLGLARQLPWEAGDWRASPIGPGAADASMDRLLAERARLLCLRDELARSRWRRLGQRLGLAKRQAWERDAPVKPVPMVAAPAEAGAAAQADEWFPEHAARSFLAECAGSGVEVVLDVGANAGQFAQGLRRSGYQGRIVSFEPLSEAHAALSRAAADDPLWDVATRCAVGAAEGQAEINVSANSYSSSLLPMLAAHQDAAPHSAYRDKESCTVVTLDSFIARGFADPMTTFGLKIDTQGFEAAVLGGAGGVLSQVRVVLCEMSLVPLYDGAPSMTELSRLLAAKGYRCVALGPAFEDPRTGELLQVDGVFVRRD